MAPRLRFSYWVLVCWLVVTVAEGQEVVTPPGGSQNDVNPTDCQIFTLTPPPATRNPVTRVQATTRATRTLFPFFPPRRPGVYPRFPNRPFLPPRCNHPFHFRPFRWPRGPFTWGRYFVRRVRKESSSEESRERRAART